MSGVLSQLGVQRGDVVLIYMPMIPEAVEAMLATVRLGGIHAVVFGGKLSLVKTIFIRPEDFCFFRQLTIFYVIFIFSGFAAKELAVRIRHVEPKVILTASYGVEPNRVIQ